MARGGVCGRGGVFGRGIFFAGVDVSSLRGDKDDIVGDGGVLGRGMLLFIITGVE